MDQIILTIVLICTSALIGVLILPAILIRHWLGEWDWKTIKGLYKFLWEL